MKCAFGYLRVSTEEQTILNQKLVLQKWADERGYQVIDFFEDSAVSGKIPAAKRKAFQESARACEDCTDRCYIGV